MKFLIFILSTLPIICLAQEEFAPIGAKWFQNHSGSESTQLLHAYFVKESIGDTIIDNKNFRVVIDSSHIDDFGINPYHYFHQIGGKIYFWYGDSLNLMYDFEAEMGDTVRHSFLDRCSFNEEKLISWDYEIKETGQIEIDNISLKTVKIEAIDTSIGPPFSPYFHSEFYIERMGGSRRLIEDLGGCVNTLSSFSDYLRCYVDSEIHYKSDFFLYVEEQVGEELDCRVEGVNSTNDKDLSVDQIILNPNPVNNFLNISFEQRKPFSGTIRVFSADAKLVEEVYLDNEIAKIIFTEKYSKGLYFLQLSNEAGFVTKKFIKN